ncbi:MAG: YitT family protein [Ruminococcaceae bacterium]|nr:YitT family protein [Oscillospiraceae bacterium]
MKKQTLRAVIAEYLLITAGCMLLAAGMTVFLVPVKLSSGGIGTVSTVLLHLFSVPLWVTTLCANALLFPLGLKFLGKGSALKTLWGVIALSLFLEFGNLLPAFQSDPIICSICGGVAVGLGLGTVIRVDGSTGGSDFIGQMIKRLLPHLNLATVILTIDCAVIAISGLVFKSFTVTFYSILAMFISSKVTDWILTIGEKAKTLQIISSRHEKITRILLSELGRGVTVLHGRGGYTKNEKPLLLCVLSPKQAPKAIRSIKATDPDAFVIVSDATEVLGKGF